MGERERLIGLGIIRPLPTPQELMRRGYFDAAVAALTVPLYRRMGLK